MIRHVVLFRWDAAASPQAVAEVSPALSGLPDAIDAIKAYRFGPDAGLAEGNWDYSVTADFADEAAYVAYRDHPAHQDVIEQTILPIVAERAAMQVVIDD